MSKYVKSCRYCNELKQVDELGMSETLTTDLEEFLRLVEHKLVKKRDYSSDEKKVDEIKNLSKSNGEQGIGSSNKLTKIETAKKSDFVGSLNENIK